MTFIPARICSTDLLLFGRFSVTDWATNGRSDMLIIVGEVYIFVEKAILASLLFSSDGWLL